MAAESVPGATPADKTDTAASDDGAGQSSESTSASAASHIVTYTCGHDAEHTIPGDDVRVMAWGATGFEVACTCGPEPLVEADEPPHDSVDHIASVKGSDPSPEEWLALEDVRDGWFHENPWQLVESEGKNGLCARMAVLNCCFFNLDSVIVQGDSLQAARRTVKQCRNRRLDQQIGVGNDCYRIQYQDGSNR